MIEDKIREEAKNLNIMNFKLVSGEEIIAVINRNKPSESVVLVEEPLMLVMIHNNDNSFSVNFQEWNPIAQEGVTAILRSNIVAYSKCTLDAKEQYLSTIIALHTNELKEEPIEEEVELKVKPTVIH